jgi:hypothetical protein
LYGAEVGHFVKQITNASKVLICGVGKGWRRKAGPINSVRNEEVLCRIKEERNIVSTIKRRKTSILSRNCLVELVIEEMIKERGEGGGEESSYCKLFFCLTLGFLHGVQGEFTEDVSETAVTPIFTGHE